MHATRAIYIALSDRIVIRHEILGTEHLGVELLRIFTCELLVAEVNQNHETAEVLKVKVRHIHVALSPSHVGLSD